MIFYRLILTPKSVIPFKNISSGRRMKKTYGISWIHQIHSLVKDVWSTTLTRFLIGYLRFRTNPRVNHFVEGKVKCRSKSEKIVCSSKSDSKVYPKLKEHVSHNSHTGYKKSTVPQPHVNGRVMVKFLCRETNFIQPTLRGYIRFFDTPKFEIPPIYQNTSGQMHENCFKKITKTGNGKTHQKTQNHALIAVEKRATCRKILSHWLSYSGHNVYSFILYFTTFDPKKLHFFKYLQGLTILSFSIQRRCA